MSDAEAKISPDPNKQTNKQTKSPPTVILYSASDTITLPAPHLAVHDGWRVEVGQQVVHQIIVLLVSLDHAVIAGHVGPQDVLHQLLQALLLALAVSLEQATEFARLEVTLE